MNRFANTGEMTPPTQWRTLGGLLVAVTVCGIRACVAVPLVEMECRMVMRSGPMRTSLMSRRSTRRRSGTGGGGRVAAQAGEEAFEVFGQLEVGLSVDELGSQRVELGAQAGFAGTQLVEGDQLFLVGLDQPGDGRAGLGQCLFQAVLLTSSLQWLPDTP